METVSFALESLAKDGSLASMATVEAGGGSRGPARCRRAARGVAIAIGALALAACGGDEGGDSGPAANSPEPAPPSQDGGANNAPTVSGSPAAQVMADSPFEFAPTSDDADGDTLTFTVENLPEWAIFDAATGLVSGTPGQGDVGTYSGIAISVTDGEATTVLTAFDVEVVATAMGSATLSWTAPTQKTDGSPLVLSGYKIYWGTSPGNYMNSVEVDNPGLVNYVVGELTPATWYFAATAIDDEGVESEFSNEASKQIL